MLKVEMGNAGLEFEGGMRVLPLRDCNMVLGGGLDEGM